MRDEPPPVIGFAACSGTGKTTLLRRLIPRLVARGLRIGVVKHTHHDFDIDHPGKDSHTLRQAGASRVALGSSRRWALIVERPEPREATLIELLAPMREAALDLVLVEGFRHERFAKIEVHRRTIGRGLLALEDDSIIAVATDDPNLDCRGLPRLDLDDIASIEEFVMDYLAHVHDSR